VNAKLKNKIDELALAPVLLVGSDYDGTLAPIVSDPRKAKPCREAIVALKTLASLPQTHVAVISGRALNDLAQFLDTQSNIKLIGSHGSEFEPGFASRLNKREIKLRNILIREIKKIIQGKTGFFIEQKPASISLHYRNAGPQEATLVLKAVIQGPAAKRGTYLRHGKKVVEISVVSIHKGMALEKIRHRVGASVVIFFGDDKTDEDAFQSLRGPDVGVKVGKGESLASYRIKDAQEVAQFLARLAERRCHWLEGAHAFPIENHSLLSDQRTFALSSALGRINWFCVPRLDSGAIFSELLGGPSAGYFMVSPKAPSAQLPTQHYKNHSMELVTKWPNFSVTDYLDCSGERTSQRAGRTDLIRVIEGSGSIQIEFAPRLDFGRVATRIRIRNEGLEIEDSVDPIVLRSPGVKWKLKAEGNHHTAFAELKLKKSKPLTLELRYGTGNLSASFLPESQRRKKTHLYWSRWLNHLQIPDLPKRYEQALIRSALTLKALCHGPSGAIAAAATTSLPESLGGIRNWDYRFCWLRDAAMAAHALADLESIREGMAYLDWVLDIIDHISEPERLRPLYEVNGGSVMAEAEISGLSGYAGSRPIRIGNAAAQQVQLDVFGPIVDLVWKLTQLGAPLSADHWRLVEAMVKAVDKRWQEPDHGIWELRTERRHHTHSKVMCWLTLDRAIKLAGRFLERKQHKWEKLRDNIQKDILKNAWNPRLKSFAAFYKGSELDAATLHTGLSGMLEGKDTRFLQSVEAIEKHLREESTVFRYRMDDGLPGSEGGFHLCTCWLIQSYVLVGKKAEAKELLSEYLKCAGSTGLYPEQFNLKTKRGLGNHPQAYSHLGLIQSILCLHRAHLI